MFKYFLLFIGLFTGTQLLAQRKVFSANVFFGGTATQVQGDGLAGFDKPGLTTGFGVRGRLDRKWSMGFDLAYVQKGSRKVQDPDNNDFTYYRLSLHYAEVPILVQYNTKKLSFFAGPTIGYLLASSEETTSGIQEIQNPFRKLELGLTGGASYKFSKNWSIASSIQESALSIRATPAYAKGFLGRYSGQYNTALYLRLIYHFSQSR